jgi:hypothetical protein
MLLCKCLYFHMNHVSCDRILIFLYSLTQVTKAASKAGYFGLVPQFKRFKPGCALSNCGFLDIQLWSSLSEC